MSEKILLIDGHSILNRAFYGLPDLTNSEGKHTGAVYGFLNILFRILEEEKPDYLTVAFDLHEPTFRHKMYEAYKGTVQYAESISFVDNELSHASVNALMGRPEFKNEIFLDAISIIILVGVIALV